MPNAQKKLFARLGRKTYDYNTNLSYLIGEEDTKGEYYSDLLERILTNQKEINSIVQEALNNESLNKKEKEGGRRTRGKLRAKSRAKSRKKRRKSRRKSRRKKTA